MARKYGADFIWTEEIIDRKFINAVRVENQGLGTIDYISPRDYSLIFRTMQMEKDKLILQIGTNNAETAVQAVQLL